MKNKQKRKGGSREEDGVGELEGGSTFASLERFSSILYWHLMILSRMMASLGFLLMLRREPSKGSLPHNIVNRITPIAQMSNGGPDVLLCNVIM